jgi:hypothetical protein
MKMLSGSLEERYHLLSKVVSINESLTPTRAVVDSKSEVIKEKSANVTVPCILTASVTVTTLLVRHLGLLNDLDIGGSDDDLCLQLLEDPTSLQLCFDMCLTLWCDVYTGEGSDLFWSPGTAANDANDAVIHLITHLLTNHNCDETEQNLNAYGSTEPLPPFGATTLEWKWLGMLKFRADTMLRHDSDV